MAVMVTDVARAMESLILEPIVVSVAAICLVSILMNIIQFLNALESMWSFSSRVWSCCCDSRSRQASKATQTDLPCESTSTVPRGPPNTSNTNKQGLNNFKFFYKIGGKFHINNKCSNGQFNELDLCGSCAR